MDAGRKEREKEVRGIWRKEKVDPKERDDPQENGQTQVTCGTALGTIHIGTVKCTDLRWIRGRLLNFFPISVQSL